MNSPLFWIAAIICTASLFKVIESLYALRKVPALWREVLAETALPHPPRLSVIVPACNEAETIEGGVRSLLQQDYPNLELILIDDRSTDETGAIIDRLARQFPQLRAIHIRHLPDGWLGKNHALWVGAREATGDILLFTDADVHFHPTTLRRAVAFLLHRQLDHLTLAPELRARGYVLEAWVAFFLMAFLAYKTPYRANDPKSKVGIGVGAFNMVRREAYERMGTHQAISLRPDDDLRLGQRMKRMGMRSNVADGHRLLSVEWYPSLSEAIRGLEKNVFAGLEYSVPLLLSSVLGMLAIMVWPYIALALSSGWTLALYGAAILLQLALFVLCTFPLGARSLYLAPFYPVAALLMAYTFARSAYLTFRRGGIVWRGTFYPLALLRSQSGLPD